MRLSFSKVFESLLKEISVRSIGIFPGKFKPPHKGHFKTCKVAGENNDIVCVFISNKEHEGFTAEQSFNVWNIYKRYIPNLFPFICTPTPVLATYDLAAILNQGEESLPGPVKSNIKEFISNCKELESYINVGNGIKLNLYSSPEDQERYSRIKKSPYIGKNVLDIDFQQVDRLTSATKFREAIRSKGNISSFLPDELSKEDKINISNILV